MSVADLAIEGFSSLRQRKLQRELTGPPYSALFFIENPLFTAVRPPVIRYTLSFFYMDHRGQSYLVHTGNKIGSRWMISTCPLRIYLQADIFKEVISCSPAVSETVGHLTVIGRVALRLMVNIEALLFSDSIISIISIPHAPRVPETLHIVRFHMRSQRIGLFISGVNSQIIYPVVIFVSGIDLQIVILAEIAP